MKDKEYYESLDKRTKEYKEYKKGLGDVIAEVTKAVGVKPCEGCKNRQAKANLLGHQVEYFFKKHNPNPFTDKDLIEWEFFINRTNQNEIIPSAQKLIVRLLKDILNMSVKPCATCNSRVWKKYIDMIQMVYERN
jgi:hypothetical protein